MNENPPEPTLHDPLAKQLQLLQNENNALRQEREDFGITLKKYGETISQLDQQLATAHQQIQEDRQLHREQTVKIRRLELDLEHINHEYKSLHQHIYVQQARGPREMLVKEIELSNQLNHIQNNSYQTTIHKLKNNLLAKNQYLNALTEENTQLKQKLLLSNHHFYEQIAALKEQIAYLTTENEHLKAPPSKTQSMFEETNPDRLLLAKIQALQDQLKVSDKQYANLMQELLSCKKDMNHYKHEAEWLQITIQKNNSEKEISMSFEEMQAVALENLELKKRIDLEAIKMNTLVRNNPALLAQLQEIELNNPLEELQTQLQTVKLQSTQKDKEIAATQKELKEATAAKNAKQDELMKFKSTTVKTINKLTTIISNYVPCFNLYGYSDFGLSPEQCKLIDQNGQDIQKSYDRVTSQLLQKSSEIKKLTQTIKQLQNKLKTKEEQLQTEIKKHQETQEENKKINLGLETLTERWITDYPATIEQQEREEQEEEMLQPQEEEEQNPNENPQQIINRDQSPARIRSLSTLVQELQNDRQKMIQVIRSKDLLLAEANAQLATLHNQYKPKAFIFEEMSLQAPSPSPVLPSFPQGPTEEQLQQQEDYYIKLRDQISAMGQLCQNELHLMQQQHTKKYSQLNLKFAKQLADNHQLQRKYNQLQNLYEQSLQQQQEQPSKQPQSISEEIQSAHYQQLVPKDDKNVISETTIQIINDLLKKYEKEFSHFSNLYESELTKTKQIRQLSHQQLHLTHQEEQLQTALQQISALLQQKQETIQLLQDELSEIQTTQQREREEQAQQYQLSSLKIKQLEDIVQQTQQQLSTIQQQNIQELQHNHNDNAKSLTFVLTTIALKNKEITQLHTQLQQKTEQIQQLQNKIADLQSTVQDQLSELELEEFRQFKKIVEEGELARIIQQATRFVETHPQPQ